MDALVAELPGWLKYGMATGLMLVVLSRVILVIDSRLKSSKTGLLIGTGSVTLTVMMTLAFTGGDEQLIPEFIFVCATGAVLFMWDCARLYARRRTEEPTPLNPPNPVNQVNPLNIDADAGSDAWPTTENS